MLQNWIISLVISFVLRQIDKFKETIDWAKVRLDLDVRVRALVPGTFFDAEAVAIADWLLDSVIYVLSAQGHLQSVLTKLATSDWAGALAELKELLADLWSQVGPHQPQTPAKLKVAAHVAGLDFGPDAAAA